MSNARWVVRRVVPHLISSHVTLSRKMSLSSPFLNTTTARKPAPTNTELTTISGFIADGCRPYGTCSLVTLTLGRPFETYLGDYCHTLCVAVLAYASRVSGSLLTQASLCCLLTHPRGWRRHMSHVLSLLQPPRVLRQSGIPSRSSPRAVLGYFRK